MFSVGSPITSRSALKGSLAKALAPQEPVSSPLSNSSPKPVRPEAASSWQAVYMAMICPLASQLPRPVTLSSPTLGAM